LTGRRPARLKITFGNIEGNPTIHNISIQFGKKDSWVLRDEIISKQIVLLAPGEGPKIRTTVEAYCSFERLDQKTGSSFPPEEKRSPETYVLRLKSCKSGDTLEF
jgi:hypothetical protein